jgi:hypothetical protein
MFSLKLNIAEIVELSRIMHHCKHIPSTSHFLLLVQIFSTAFISHVLCHFIIANKIYIENIVKKY